MDRAVIRRYKKGDSTGISEFMKRCFLENNRIVVRSHEPEYYKWKYETNPYREPVAWVAESKNRIVGLMSAIPRMLWINGREVLVAESGDTFVDPDFRGGNIFLRLAQKVYSDCNERGFNFICGIPNPVSYPVITKIFMYKPLFICKSLVRPLNFDMIIQKKIPVNAISKLLGMGIKKIYNTIWSINKDDSVFIKQAENADSVFDQLWEKNSMFLNYGFVKDSKYLKWRFFDNPDEYKIFNLSEHGETIGWISLKFSTVVGFTFAQIVDYLLPKEKHKVYIRSIINFCADTGVDFAEIWAVYDSMLYSELRKTGFMSRKKEFRFVMKENKMELMPEMLNKNLWIYNQADSDNI
ncbi:GNAT family N-acetyltransferase [bacterium]|nr:GNAT family N-acetyltransferase [bacterium]